MPNFAWGNSMSAVDASVSVLSGAELGARAIAAQPQVVADNHMSVKIEVSDELRDAFERLRGMVKEDDIALIASALAHISAAVGRLDREYGTLDRDSRITAELNAMARRLEGGT